MPKPGKYGTLYRYEITYSDDDPGAPVQTWRTWAYSIEDAIDRFYDSDNGWRAPSVSRAWLTV